MKKGERKAWQTFFKGESESALQTFLKIGESEDKSETFPAEQEEQCAGIHHSEIKDTREQLQHSRDPYILNESQI